MSAFYPQSTSAHIYNQYNSHGDYNYNYNNANYTNTNYNQLNQHSQYTQYNNTTSTMSDVQSKIQAAAQRNQELLAILAETDYAPPALKQQKSYIADLEAQLKALNTNIGKLEKKHEIRKKEYDSYKDSVMKRFAYKMTRRTEKFDAKASKEEQEYFAVLKDEQNAKDARTSTQSNLDQANAHRADLEKTQTRHTQAQHDLDALYDGIFEGPTPGFADEDQKESLAQHALQTYQTTRSQMEAEQQALAALSSAISKMNHALTYMEDALSHSRMDMFGGGTFTDMMERSALHSAEKSCLEAQMSILQAQRLSPHIASIPQPQIAQGNLMSDVFFDNIFTDMAFHDKIKASRDDVRRCAGAVDQEGKKTKGRLDELKGRLGAEGRDLEGARAALQRAREDVFSSVTQSQAPPPAYQA